MISPPGRGTVAEMTAALRNGLHARRLADPPPPLPPVPPPEPVDVVAPLLPVSTLLGHRAGAKRILVGPIVRLVRRAAKGLIRPWLDLQTQFNHRSIGVLDDFQTRTHASLARLHQRCEELERALARTGLAHQALALRVSECLDDAIRDRGRVRQLGDAHETLKGRVDTLAAARAVAVARTAEEGPTPAGRLTERVIETVFVHTRLPAPPAHLLELGPAGAGGPLDLAAIGYQVAGVDPLDLTPAHGIDHRVPAAPYGELPCPPSGFDAVVAVGNFGLSVPGGTVDAALERHVAAEVFRVVRPGGRLILSVPFTRTAVATESERIHDRASLSRLLSGLVTVELAYAVPTADGWTFTADPPAGDDTALALVVAEKH